MLLTKTTLHQIKNKLKQILCECKLIKNSTNYTFGHQHHHCPNCSCRNTIWNIILRALFTTSTIKQPKAITTETFTMLIQKPTWWMETSDNSTAIHCRSRLGRLESPKILCPKTSWTARDFRFLAAWKLSNSRTKCCFAQKSIRNYFNMKLLICNKSRISLDEVLTFKVKFGTDWNLFLYRKHKLMRRNWLIIRSNC